MMTSIPLHHGQPWISPFFNIASFPHKVKSFFCQNITSFSGGYSHEQNVRNAVIAIVSGHGRNRKSLRWYRKRRPILVKWSCKTHRPERGWPLSTDKKSFRILLLIALEQTFVDGPLQKNFSCCCFWIESILSVICLLFLHWIFQRWKIPSEKRTVGSPTCLDTQCPACT